MRVRIHPAVVLAASVLACSLWLGARAMTAVSRNADRYMRRQVTDARFSGAVLIGHDGRIAFARAYGYANAEWHVPNTLDTKFRIGSLTKQFTAVAVMQQVVRGKLRITDPICTYLDPCPAVWKRITIEELLSHTSGIPGLTESPNYAIERRLPETHARLVAMLGRRPLEFSPGTRMRYSNSNYYLLGMILERVTGRPFETVLDDSIFKPLGMRDTGYDHPERLLPRRASGYESTPDGSIRNADYVDTTWPFAAGALYSTVGDLEKWNAALDRDVLLPRPLLNRMWTRGTGDYGYGWVVPPPSSFTLGRRMIYHSGRIEGFVSCMSHFPEQRLTVIVLENVVAAQHACTVAIDLAAIGLGDADAVSLPPHEVTLDPRTLARYVGSYRVDERLSILVTEQGEHLFAHATGFPTLQMLPESEKVFFFREIDARVEFLLSARGSVVGMQVHLPRQSSLYAERVRN